MLFSCNPKEPDVPAETNLVASVPNSIDVEVGKPCELPIKEGSVSAGEFVAMTLTGSGKATPCKVLETSNSVIKFNLPEAFVNGVYKLELLRNQKRILLSNAVTINSVSRLVKIEEGTTIYGTVDSEDGPVEGVVVSDGLNCVTTDKNGVYQLKSKKEQGVVFISVPSGYEPTTNGAFPEIYKQLTLKPDVPENASFVIKKVGNQDNFKILFFGDMHLAKRTNDEAQFEVWAKDVMTYCSAHSGEKIYGITLGDMTWDGYWKNGYELKDYVTTLNKSIKNLTVYNCIGNHDHDPSAIASNLDAVRKFQVSVAPAWYSFNIGQVHFVVLDNIDCSGYDGVQDRPYTEHLYGSELEWLRNDLAHVDKSLPVYVMTHGSLFAFTTSAFNSYPIRTYDSDKKSYYNYDEVVKAFTGREVHFVNGHLHQNHTALPKDPGPNAYSSPVYEHNIAAVCSDWWYSGYYSGVLLSTDGSPSGYGIFDFAGKSVKWKYKGAKMDENIQWRAYDLNNVDFRNVEFTKSSSTVFTEFKRKYVNHTYSNYNGTRVNEVLINVFNWNSDCKIEVKTDGGEVLTATPKVMYDPLSILAMTIPYWDRGITSIPGTGTSGRYHFFIVKCPDAKTGLTIKVTDKFGNVDERKMSRPMPFDLETYKLK